MARRRILGIDPGSLKTGFGVVDFAGGRLSYVTSGTIRIGEKPLPERLRIIEQCVGEIIQQHSPHEMAIEDVFFAKNPQSALKLGQARGAAIVAGVIRDLSVSEYAARRVKQSISGSGAATKQQVQFMVQNILKLDACPAEDAADALAVAICHAQHGASAR